MTIGIDISKISRFEKFLDNEKFYNRVFTRNEIELINKRTGKRKLETIAGRFSAKEAVSKALGTGIGEIGFKDIEILNGEKGKPELFLYNKAKELCKQIVDKNLEVSISHDGDYVISVAKEADYRPVKIDLEIGKLLKSRRDDSHKGDYGKIALIGGSKGMCGSIHISSMAALRTGSGLVYTVVPNVISDIMQIKALENIIVAMDKEEKSDKKNFFNKLTAFGIGPGMGKEYNYDFIRFFLEEFNKPIVIDADGLNIVAKNMDKLPKNKKLIFTPHEMEMSRLSGLSVDFIHNNREEVALEFARKNNIVLVLKGNRTIITNGKEIYINKYGNSGMATAGSGDVLTGIITSLAGQGYDTYLAAKVGVIIHGIAGDLAKNNLGEDGIIARDILERIPYAIKLIREIKS
ncbi:NAD(P)H-hydrate dehydratase [Miniphocaeibacter halophilus]|uniref:NAD(P)H-hydrate dehydratase n=1 Tax=Miniphocaeibacter halophilus TaxID=2931922 RepID=A0AC61MSN8_9FIRM|nr:NAD(P)H-hydrate dehydratase [Miniphocaeibacter halophilus]QQK07474.1 NAD(P)H-hydrate dehydratase [Miniphocaeibacter halophilus]